MAKDSVRTKTGRIREKTLKESSRDNKKSRSALVRRVEKTQSKVFDKLFRIFG